MGIKELIAAKKAAAEQLAKAEKIEEAPKEMENRTIPEPVKEVAATQASKPMSFAEKMALKKLEQEKLEQKQNRAESLVAASVSTGITQTEVDKTEALRTGSMVAALDPNMPPASDVSPADKQAYTDVKQKLDLLETLAEESLENAIVDLRKSLHANPNAVSLLEDTDIGKMVIALRRYAGEAIAEAAKEKTPGRKKKAAATVDLSDPQAVAKLFEEI